MSRCKLRRYRDELSAKIALAEIHRRDSPKRVSREAVAVRCGACAGWHLRAKEKVA